MVRIIRQDGVGDFTLVLAWQEDKRGLPDENLITANITATARIECAWPGYIFCRALDQ